MELIFELYRWIWT